MADTNRNPSNQVRFSLIFPFTLSLPSTSKTNTSVPSMFQGLLNIEGLLVQHRVSPEPTNISLWSFHRMLLIYKYKFLFELILKR